jgi:hypothetical protein
LDTSRLSQGERIIAICSGLLVLFSFFPLWAKYESSVGGEEATERGSAWSNAFNFTAKLAILLAITLLVLVVLRALGSSFDLGVNRGLIYLALGGLATLLLFFLLLTGPKDIPGASEAEEMAEALGVDISYEVSRGIMLFVGFFLAIGTVIGSYLHMQTEADEPAPPTTPPPVS